MPVGHDDDVDLREVRHLDRAVRVRDERVRDDDLAGRRREPEDGPGQPLHLDRARLRGRLGRPPGQHRRHRPADHPAPSSRHGVSLPVSTCRSCRRPNAPLARGAGPPTRQQRSVPKCSRPPPRRSAASGPATRACAVRHASSPRPSPEAARGSGTGGVEAAPVTEPTTTARCCIAGGGPAGDDAGPPPRPGRRRRPRPREARRLPARLPRRHDPPVDARGDARAGPPRRLPRAAPRGVYRISAQVGDVDGAGRRLHHLSDALPLHRVHAPVGLPELPRRGGTPPSHLPALDAGRGHRPDRGVGPRGRARGRDARRAARRSGRAWWSAPTAAHPLVRERAGLAVEELGAPIDVLWFRLSRASRRPGPDHGAIRRGPDLHHDQPGRALAVRLRDREGRARRDATRRASRPSAGRSRGWRPSRPTA